MTQVAIPKVFGASVEDADAVDYGGYVAQVVDAVYEKVKPRWTAIQREKLEQAGRPADDRTLGRLLAGFPADWATSFSRHKKLIGVDKNGAQFVPRLPVPDDAGEGYRDVELDAYNLVDSYRADADRKKKEAGSRMVPKYFLHQIFSDVSVAEKLLIDAGLMIVLSRMAVGDPKAACDTIVRHAKANGMEVSVRVGDYSTSRKASRQRILSASNGLTCVPYTCEVIGSKVAVEGASGVGSVPNWTITADLWQMPEVDAVYRLAVSKGATIVNTLFTHDMAKLGVELTPNGSDFGFDVQWHVGEYDGTISGNRVSAYGALVVDSSHGVYPVVHDDKVMATAIYAGDNQFFVNWHVVSDLHTKMIEGVSFVAVRLDSETDTLYRLSLLSEVACDVWLAEVELSAHERLIGLEPPICRSAEPGEEVVAVYAVPTGVEATDSVRVITNDAGAVCMPRFPQARGGMSGAAIISVADGALLGSYTGSNRTFSLGSSLNKQGTIDWLGASVAAEIAPHAHFSNKGANAVYQDLKARGLGEEISRVSRAIKPLMSSGRRIGNEFLHVKGGTTIVDPTAWRVVDEDGLPLDFHKVPGGGARALRPGETAGPIGRFPKLDERVFAVHKDEQGVIFSDLLRVAWVSSDNTSCRLDDVPRFEGKLMKGSVLVALADCAPLGLISRVDEAEWGYYSECTTWLDYSEPLSEGRNAVVKRELFDRLAHRFDRLKMSTWDSADVRALTVGDVPAVGSYARVGVAASLSLVLAELSGHEIRGVEQIVAARMADEAWMVALCERALQDDSVVFGLSCLERANTLRVFLGLVHLREGYSGLGYVLDELGLFSITGYDQVDYDGFVSDVISRPKSI